MRTLDKEKLFRELIKLNKKDWDILKNGIDYLFLVESKNQEKNLFLDPTKIDERLKSSPIPIHQLFE